MPKRRTRSQKEAANHSFTYSFNRLSPPTAAVAGVKASLPQPSNPASVSVKFPKLIVLDLVKTISISAVIFAIQIGLYIFWR